MCWCGSVYLGVVLDLEINQFVIEPVDRRKISLIKLKCSVKLKKKLIRLKITRKWMII